MDDFRQDSLNKVNLFRVQHGAQPLKLNKQFCEEATIRAKHCAANHTLISRLGETFGETFLEVLKRDFIITGGLAPRHWYAESIGYDYTKEPTTDQYNNFTQLIWNDSTDFGVGIAASLKGIMYIIGHFLPRGNKVNRYIENVFPPKEKNSCCPCGCGYIAPACVQDLTTTIISRQPTLTSQDTSINYEHYTNRSFTVVGVEEDSNNTIPKGKSKSALTDKNEISLTVQSKNESLALPNVSHRSNTNTIQRDGGNTVSQDRTQSALTGKNEINSIVQSKNESLALSNVSHRSNTNTIQRDGGNTVPQDRTQSALTGKNEISSILQSKKGGLALSQMSPKSNLITVESISKNNAQLHKSKSREYVMTQSKTSTVTSKIMFKSLSEFNLDAKKIREEMLQSHNKYRELHSAPPLQYSNDLEINAQAWAETLAINMILTYGPESQNFSENCAEIRNPETFKGEDITDLWYSQEKNFDYENLYHTGPIDQFSVMMWNSSTKVGYGIAASLDDRIFVVAHYSPPGLIGDFKANIKPSKLYKKPSAVSQPIVPKEATLSSYKGIKKEELKEFQLDALGKLNNFRLRHNSPPLKLNDNLCKAALDLAKRCATNQMLLSANQNRHGETYLELTIKNFTITGGLAPRHWYAECIGYEFDKEPQTNQYHNFTQMVWKSSTEMGIGVAASLMGVLYVIGSFYPSGNIPNQYLENILPPNKETKFCTCGCGYLAPACIQDLRTTVTAKLPSMLTTEKSKMSLHGASVRSYSVLESKGNRDTQKTTKSIQLSQMNKQEKNSTAISDAPTLSVHQVKSKESLATSQSGISKIQTQSLQQQSTEKASNEVPNKSITENFKNKGSQSFTQSQISQPFNAQKTLSNVTNKTTERNVTQSIAKEPLQVLQPIDTQRTLSNVTNKTTERNVTQSIAKEPSQLLQPMNTPKTFSSVTNKTTEKNVTQSISKEPSQLLQPMNTPKTFSSVTNKTTERNVTQSIAKEPLQVLQPMDTQKTLSSVTNKTIERNVTQSITKEPLQVLQSMDTQKTLSSVTNKTTERNVTQSIAKEPSLVLQPRDTQNALSSVTNKTTTERNVTQSIAKEPSLALQPRDTQKTLSNVTTKTKLEKNMNELTTKESIQIIKPTSTQKTASNVPNASTLENFKSNVSQNAASVEFKASNMSPNRNMPKSISSASEYRKSTEAPILLPVQSKITPVDTSNENVTESKNISQPEITKIILLNQDQRGNENGSKI